MPSVDGLIARAALFGKAFEAVDHPTLRGVSDGKTIGGYIELAFKKDLAGAGIIEAVEGNAAKGIDLPSFNIDIKVTSHRQPQSSSPFKTFKQKIEGLGYGLIIFVYEKSDERDKNLRFVAVRYIPAELTGDHQTTKGLRQIIDDPDGNVDDVTAFLADRNIPADEAELYEYANWLMENPPALGYLTISNALQWRLKYERVVKGGIAGIDEIL
ncbi:MAG: restriction endonuclease [Actinobacteria bacterium]|nr:restriction endonuclease [Actinomycetota bacterium]OJU84321.1 MAG: hypothetical protein BGO11_16800 [Solirubrobacterales bacterium 70-9]